MRTEVMRPGEDTPYLEHYSSGKGQARKIVLDPLPFVVGRDESTHLQLDSGRVSREHAQFQREAGGIVLRDLGSTNGTFVNGRRIEEHVLDDGDIVLFADLEFTFCAGAAEASRATATQVIDGDPATRQLLSDSAAIVLEVRRLQEVLAHGVVCSRFEPIVDLSTQDVFAFQAVASRGRGGSIVADGSELLHLVECQLGDRLRQVLRMAAVADAARLDEEACVVLDVHPSELGSDRLVDSFRRLRYAAGETRPLAVQVPESAVSDSDYFLALRDELRRLNVTMGYTGFAAGRGRVLEHSERPPDFLKLDPSLVRYINRSKRRQSQVQSLVEACEELGIRLIAEGIRTESEAALLQQLGCRYGQGRFCGAPQTAAHWAGSYAA